MPVDSKKRLQYPVNSQKRKYNPEWEVKFPWLRYSESEDGTYCSCCYAFAKSFTSNDPLISAPFKDWKNAIGVKRGILTNHEMTKCHRSSMVAAENFMLVTRKEKESIKESLNRSYSDRVQKNRDALCSILDVVILLAKRGIPFRGRWDKSAKRDNGNFEYFIHWLAKYDNNLSDHLSSAAKNARYLSPQVQNEMIDCLGEVICSTLVSKVNKSKFISIMADETTDVSTIEQLSVYVRYLDMSSVINNVEVDEVFLRFVPLPRTDSATITDLLIDHVKREEEILLAATNRECLPTLSDTRWLSRVDSISTLLVNYSRIYDAISEVMMQSTGKASHDASGFLRALFQQFSLNIS
ncbi:uncharacterized protein LOC114575707 [Exaiptasia diaphana]|uniref:TTF-type domain-containing protein n=1 Tax=Exaiptasia diaphana TaxID=2652724 RepID=A0A913YPG4_EXADI|nr:uncharacterized protein LOC114575707 [Exaiptasia diaphana]